MLPTKTDTPALFGTYTCDICGETKPYTGTRQKRCPGFCVALHLRSLSRQKHRRASYIAAQLREREQYRTAKS